jgi:hypothetical protein
MAFVFQVLEPAVFELYSVHSDIILAKDAAHLPCAVLWTQTKELLLLSVDEVFYLRQDHVAAFALAELAPLAVMKPVILQLVSLDKVMAIRTRCQHRAAVLEMAEQNGRLLEELVVLSAVAADIYDLELAIQTWLEAHRLSFSNSINAIWVLVENAASLVGCLRCLLADQLIRFCVVSAINELTGLVDELSLGWPDRAELGHQREANLLVDRKQDNVGVLTDESVATREVLDCIIDNSLQVDVVGTNLMLLQNVCQKLETSREVLGAPVGEGRISLTVLFAQNPLDLDPCTDQRVERALDQRLSSFELEVLVWVSNFDQEAVDYHIDVHSELFLVHF